MESHNRHYAGKEVNKMSDQAEREIEETNYNNYYRGEKIMSELEHEINEENLADVTGGVVWETADERWERLSRGLVYVGKPCPRCGVSSNGRYSLYCDRGAYPDGGPGGKSWFQCFNCGLWDIFLYIEGH